MTTVQTSASRICEKLHCSPEELETKVEFLMKLAGVDPTPPDTKTTDYFDLFAGKGTYTGNDSGVRYPGFKTDKIQRKAQSRFCIREQIPVSTQWLTSVELQTNVRTQVSLTVRLSPGFGSTANTASFNIPFQSKSGDNYVYALTLFHPLPVFALAHVGVSTQTFRSEDAVSYTLTYSHFISMPMTNPNLRLFVEKPMLLTIADGKVVLNASVESTVVESGTKPSSTIGDDDFLDQKGITCIGMVANNGTKSLKVVGLPSQEMGFAHAMFVHPSFFGDELFTVAHIRGVGSSTGLVRIITSSAVSEGDIAAGSLLRNLHSLVLGDTIYVSKFVGSIPHLTDIKIEITCMNKGLTEIPVLNCNDVWANFNAYCSDSPVTIGSQLALSIPSKDSGHNFTYIAKVVKTNLGVGMFGVVRGDTVPEIYGAENSVNIV